MIGLDSYSGFYWFGRHFDLYQSLNRLPIWNSQNCSMFPLAFVAGWLQGLWWGFISRNYVVWPTFLLMNVFTALKGSHFWFLLHQVNYAYANSLQCHTQWFLKWFQYENWAPSKDSDQPGHPPSLIRVSTVRLKQNWVLSYTLSAQRRLWSDWVGALADLSLRWAQKSFCWFCPLVAQNASSSSLHMQHIYISSYFLWNRLAMLTISYWDGIFIYINWC